MMEQWNDGMVGGGTPAPPQGRARSPSAPLLQIEIGIEISERLAVRRALPVCVANATGRRARRIPPVLFPASSFQFRQYRQYRQYRYYRQNRLNRPACRRGVLAAFLATSPRFDSGRLRSIPPPPHHSTIPLSLQPGRAAKADASNFADKLRPARQEQAF